MHYRLGFSSKLENSSVYIECSVRKPGVNHPIREIVKRFGKKKDLLAQDPLALEKIQREVDEMNRNCKGRQLVSSPASLESLSSDLSTLLERQSLDKQAVFETRSAGCLILQRLYDVNFQRFPTLDAKKLVNAPKMSAHHRGICHF